LIKRYFGRRTTNYKWAQLGSNQRPTGYEPAALTAELWALAERIVPYLPRLGKIVFLVGVAYPSQWVQFFVVQN
jgi:hypothetical protein